MVLICFASALLVACVSALRWKMDFYALFVMLVEKELPTPSEKEMMELRQYVFKNAVNDFFKKF